MVASPSYGLRRELPLGLLQSRYGHKNRTYVYDGLLPQQGAVGILNGDLRPTMAIGILNARGPMTAYQQGCWRTCTCTVLRRRLPRSGNAAAYDDLPAAGLTTMIYLLATMTYQGVYQGVTRLEFECYLVPGTRKGSHR